MNKVPKFFRIIFENQVLLRLSGAAAFIVYSVLFLGVATAFKDLDGGEVTKLLSNLFVLGAACLTLCSAAVMVGFYDRKLEEWKQKIERAFCPSPVRRH